MSKGIYDTVIVGSGPAGWTSGLYASRGGLKSLLIESFVPPSQILIADLIENYPGFPEGISGFSLIEKFKKQAINFGLEISPGKVDNISAEKNTWKVKTETDIYQSLSVILAVGAGPKRLGVKGEAELVGKGVSYCAVCDGAFFKDKDIVVVGGGDSAVSEALYLTRFARKVFLVHRRNRLRAVAVLVQRAKANEKIEFIWDSVVTEIYGSRKVEGVGLKNVADESERRLDCDGIFVSIGYVPNTGFLGDVVKLNSAGYIVTDEFMRTSAEGMVACGDCRPRPLRQVVTASGEGAVAAFSIIEYIDQVRGQG